MANNEESALPAEPVEAAKPADVAPQAAGESVENNVHTESKPAVAPGEPVDASKLDAKPEAGDAAEEEEVKPRFLAVGDSLPELPELETEESSEAAKKTVSLSDVVKQTGVIIFIYPRANTPGCTNQANGFRDNVEGVKAAGYQVFGLSADKPKSQAVWKTKNTLPFTLLCDPTLEAIKALGANKGDKGIARAHLVVEKGGKVLQAQYNIKPKDSVTSAVQLATGKPAVLPPKTSRRPTVIEEEIDEDQPPRSKLDEPPLSSKRRSKPSTRKVEAEQDALEIGELDAEDEDDGDDEDTPRKRATSRGRLNSTPRY